MSGNWLVNLFILGVNQVEPNPTVVLIVNLPAGLVFLSISFFSKIETEVLIWLTVLNKFSPCSVNLTPFWWRINKGVFKSYSRSWICLLRADWLIFNFALALEMLFEIAIS